MKHSFWREWIVILLLLFAVISAAARFDWLARIDQSGYDLAMRLWQRPAIPEVVIVGIDEASLQQLGRWPWQRAIHATLLEKLIEAKPAIIALDLILTEPDKTDPQSDEVLGSAIARAGRVVLPVIPRIDEGLIIGDLPPVAKIGAGALSLAHIQSQADADGVLRRVFLMAGSGSPKFRLLGYEALVQSGLFSHRVKTAAVLVGMPVPVADRFGGAWQREHPLLVPFAGPAGTFTVIPYISVLRGDVAAGAFANKIVLVGVTADGLGDEFPTPVTGIKRAMSGVEAHANVVQALVQGIELREVDALESALLAMFAVLGVMCGYLWLNPRQSLTLAIAANLYLLLGTILLFRFGMVWISPTLALLAVATTYPLWSWRKLEATQRYFDAELARLADEPDVFSATKRRLAVTQESPASRAPRIADFIERRIATITAATERLRHLKRFVASTLECLPTAALVVDFNGRILLSNSMADQLLNGAGELAAATASMPLAGRELRDALARLRVEEGGSWDALLGTLPTTGLPSPMGAAVNGLVTPTTVEAKTIDAVPERDCVVQFAPLYSHLGEATGLIVTIADITPLRESERRRDEALRFLSHDMRSPQASIITLLEMVKEDPHSIPQTTLLARIGKYAQRTLNLADDFLRLARAERAKPSDFAIVELTQILRDVVEEGDSAARGKSIRVVLSAPYDEAWVSGDRDLLTRAVINLLSNAVKYSPDETMVAVALSLSDDGKRWRVDVIDEGFGIAPENISRLFIRFQRIEQEGQPRAEGIGLGLVFVKTVIERMGGEVSVTSQVVVNEGDAHGTTFSMALPVVDPDD